MGARGRSNDLRAIIVASYASSFLIFAVLIAAGKLGLPSEPFDILILLSILLFWGPAIAFLPVVVLGYSLERPLSQRLLAQPSGGFAVHLIVVTAAALALWLLLRIAVVVSGPQDRIMDNLSLVLFGIVGICSALSWWIMVIRPGRQALADGGVA